MPKYFHIKVPGEPLTPADVESLAQPLLHPLKEDLARVTAERDALRAKVREMDAWLEEHAYYVSTLPISDDSKHHAGQAVANSLETLRSLFGLEAGDE